MTTIATCWYDNHEIPEFLSGKYVSSIGRPIRRSSSSPPRMKMESIELWMCYRPRQIISNIAVSFYRIFSRIFILIFKMYPAYDPRYNVHVLKSIPLPFLPGCNEKSPSNIFFFTVSKDTHIEWNAVRGIDLR